MLVHAQLMRPIGHSRNVVRMLAATLTPEHCNSGHCGKFCRWSHLISSAEGPTRLSGPIESCVAPPNLSSVRRAVLGRISAAFQANKVCDTAPIQSDSILRISTARYL